MKIVIPLPPITKKNSQRILRHGSRAFIGQSKQYVQYEKDCAVFIPTKYRKGLSEPLEVKCTYYMPTRRKVDLTNLLAATDDILVKYGVIEDDNSKIIVSHDGSRVLYDKENPRTEIEIEVIE